MGIQILHNSRCSKSREALQYLENQNIDFELINIIQNPLNKQEVVSVLQKLGMKAEDLVRKVMRYLKKNMQDRN